MVDPTMKPEGYGEVIQKLLGRLSPEERLRGIPLEVRLRGIPVEERLRGIPLEERLRGIPLEERLRGIPLEERLRGISREQVVLAMPDEILRVLSDDYIQSLPAQVQHAIRERLGHRG